MVTYSDSKLNSRLNNKLFMLIPDKTNFQELTKTIFGIICIFNPCRPSSLAINMNPKVRVQAGIVNVEISLVIVSPCTVACLPASYSKLAHLPCFSSPTMTSMRQTSNKK